MLEHFKIIGGDGREYGPVTLEELRQWCTDGRVGPGTQIWQPDESRWRPAATVDQLKWDLPTPPPVQTSRAAAPAAVRAAGFWIRLAAYLVDFLILGMLVSLVTLPWADALEQIQKAAFAELKSSAPNLSVIEHFWIVFLAIKIPASFLYFVGFNGAWGATPGKLALGLKILTLEGTPLGYRRAFLRHCAEWVTCLTFGIGFLMVALSPEKRALHDLMARTRVVWLRPFAGPEPA